VIGHDGRAWRVRRRWLPWRPRLRRVKAVGKSDGLMAVDTTLDSPEGIIAGIFVAIAVGVLLVLVLPLALAPVEVVLVLVVLPAVVVLRAVFRAPWIIEARTPGPPAEQIDRAVAGWGASVAAMEKLAQELQLGTPAPPPAA
jgi:hypothetical protein